MKPILIYIACATVTAFACGFLLIPDKNVSRIKYIFASAIWPIVWISAFLAFVYALGVKLINRKEKKQ